MGQRGRGRGKKRRRRRRGGRKEKRENPPWPRGTQRGAPRWTPRREKEICKIITVSDLASLYFEIHGDPFPAPSSFSSPVTYRHLSLFFLSSFFSPMLNILVNFRRMEPVLLRSTRMERREGSKVEGRVVRERWNFLRNFPCPRTANEIYLNNLNKWSNLFRRNVFQRSFQRYPPWLKSKEIVG